MVTAGGVRSAGAGSVRRLAVVQGDIDRRHSVVRRSPVLGDLEWRSRHDGIIDRLKAEEEGKAVRADGDLVVGRA